MEVFRTIKADVVIELTADDVTQIIDESTPHAKINLLGRIVNSLTEEDLKAFDEKQAVTILGYLQRKQKQMQEIFLNQEAQASK